MSNLSDINCELCIYSILKDVRYYYYLFLLKKKMITAYSKTIYYLHLNLQFLLCFHCNSTILNLIY